MLPSLSTICVLFISNPNNFPIEYKVKTNAPKRYLVKPNMCRIEAGESLDLTIYYKLPKTEEEKKQHLRNRDRFLVESKMVFSNEVRSPISQDLSFKIHKQELRVRSLPSLNESEQSSSLDRDTPPPTYEDVFPSWRSGNSRNVELLSHIEGAQRELDHLQETINGLRQALRRSEDAM
ncbi:hypothetical protein H2248_004297 [Termitomyces sp. 'cryptogamus']|nr:hypothetical protein H2248_004297 [Termitomyces sp. 'cryptogamus']